MSRDHNTSLLSLQVMRERKRVPETVTAEIKPKKQKQNTASCEEQKKVDSEEMNSRTKIPPPPGCCPGSA